MKNDDNFMIDMGVRIREARQAAGLTQETLAEIIDVNKQFISDLECARTGTSIQTLRRICRACNVSSDQILFGLDDSGDIPFVIKRACRLPEHQLDMYIKYTSMFFDLLSEDAETIPDS